MPKILYFDCFSGASGDMLLAAFLDAGLPLGDLRRALGSLALEDCTVGAEKVLRAGVSATKFRVYDGAVAAGVGGQETAPRDHSHGEHGHDHPDRALRHRHVSRDHKHEDAGRRPPGGKRRESERARSSVRRQQTAAAKAARTQSHGRRQDHTHHTLVEIRALIDRSALSTSGRTRAKQLFSRLAEVEAAVHQMPVERVHLHEVGAVDSIIDIVGVVYAMEWLGADRVVSSPLNVGGGMVDSAHGRFPVPAPATLNLLHGVPIYSSGAASELVTPTGALLVTEYATEYGAVPPMQVRTVGYGAGDRNPPDTPNVLRILIGEPSALLVREQVVVLECEIDDMNPQIYGVLMDALYAAGALDVFMTPVQMKKNRPGTLLTVVARPTDRDAMSTIVFRETTTLGLRFRDMERERLDRTTVMVETELGQVRMKVGRRGGVVVNVSPEFDDCARIAAERSVGVKHVQALAMRAYLDLARSH